MECNKDEAIRVTHMAELKLKEDDLVGAKRFVLKARQLYPNLPGAVELSAVLDVHIAAQVEVGINEPESDYYGILKVKPLSDASTIKTQYHKLALLVHPDKHNKPVKEKASAAFILIKEASDVLSNKETRFQHDLKRGEKPTAKEPPKPTYTTRQPQQQDVNSKRGGKPKANPRAIPKPQPEPRKQDPPKATYSANQPRQKATVQPTPAPGAPYMFWTACPFCRMQYLCNRIFLNNQVVCQNCHFSFPANDISVHPANGATTFVSPPGLWGNNNPFPAGTSWYDMQMNKNHL